MSGISVRSFWVFRSGSSRATLLLIISMLLLISAVSPGDTHRLLGDHLANVGNRWDYDVQVTEPISLTGSATREMVSSQMANGYQTVKLRETDPLGVWKDDFLFVDGAHLISVQWGKSNYTEWATNGELLELYPQFASDTDSSRLFGYGTYRGTDQEGDYTGSEQRWITYRRRETVTVPAGAYECTVVFVRSEYHNSDGENGYGEYTIWFNAAYGIIREEVHTYDYEPGEGGEHIRYVAQLRSTNVSPPQLTISGWTGVGEVQVEFSGLATVTSDAQGFYQYTQIPYDWTGTITPSKTDYTFDPVGYNSNNLTTSYSDVNYTATYNSPLCESTYGGFADQQYRDFLDRESEPAGHQYYVQNLCSGAMTTAQVVRNFIASPEFADNYGFIARCYFCIFNNNSTTPYSDPGFRIPDYGGLVFHRATMRGIIASTGDVTLAQQTIALQFISSPEWQDRVGTLDNSEFVRFLYVNILGRPAEDAGHAYHLANLDSSVVTREDLVVQFLVSPEAQNKYANHTYVVMAYLGLLDRGAEKAGFDFHMENLVSGALDPVLFLNGFIYSPEYVNRLAGLGITVP